MAFSSLADAQTIVNIKNQRALLNLGALAVEPEQELFSLDAEGKKRSILKVKQIKDGKAVADIVKGKPEVGHSLTLRQQNPAAATTTDQSGTPQSTGRSYGVLGSYGMDTMKATIKNSAGTSYTANLKGTGFGLLGFYDHPITPSFQLRGTVGFEQFVGKDTLSVSVCGKETTPDCNINVLYLSGYGTAKYNFLNDKFKMWAAFGVGYLFPISKSSNIIKTDSLSTYALVPSLGFDIPAGKGFVPLVIDYSIFSESADVKATSISVRIGWGFRY